MPVREMSEEERVRGAKYAKKQEFRVCGEEQKGRLSKRDNPTSVCLRYEPTSLKGRASVLKDYKPGL